jgi:hypothetical protein
MLMFYLPFIIFEAFLAMRPRTVPACKTAEVRVSDQSGMGSNRRFG